MTMSREEDGQEFEEPGLIIYDVEQKYKGEIREVSPRVNRKIQKEFPNSRTLCAALKEYLPEAEVVYAQELTALETIQVAWKKHYRWQQGQM